MNPVPGRGWGYLGALLGGAVSIAANVAHSYVAAGDPAPLAVAMSVFWPVALFVAVEILARVQWPAGGRWVALRFGGLLPVAFVAALVSYRHLSGLLAHYGEDPVTVALGPLAVDGLMLMATGALIATGRLAGQPATENTETRQVTTPEPATTSTPAGDNLTAIADAIVDAIPPATDTPPPPAKRTPPRPAKARQSNADRIRKAVAKQPAMTQAEVAKILGLGERTVQRYWPRPAVAVNGHHHGEA